MNLDRARSDFPALDPNRRGGPPVYLDSACMTLVPRPVLEAMARHYAEAPGCAGRSVHRLSEEVGRRTEASRAAFGRWFGLDDAAGVVFLRNATEAINLVAQGLPWKRGDRVLISDREHNSNLVVWQRLVAERGLRLDVLPLSDDGSFDPDRLEAALARKVRLVSLFHTSNLDGRTLPVREITERAHARGALVLFDGCQAAPHLRTDLGRAQVDFYAVSAHKFLGPTGVGALLGRLGPLGELRPLVFGGEAVEETSLAGHVLRAPPYRFEAGLQDYAGIVGAHAALDYLERAGIERVEDRQRELNRYVTRELSGEPRVTVLGPASADLRSGVFAFSLEGIDPHDAAVFLDEGHRVMVRSGRHCVHSFYEARGLVGNVRASFYLYNHRADAAALVAGIRELLERVPARALSGTSAARKRPERRRSSVRRPAAGSTGAAARSARPRRRAGPGRAGSATGTG